jgi:hypothetical protein
MMLVLVISSLILGSNKTNKFNVVSLLLPAVMELSGVLTEFPISHNTTQVPVNPMLPNIKTLFREVSEN